MRFSAVCLCLLACASLASALQGTVAPGWSVTPYVQATGSQVRAGFGQAWDVNGDYYVCDSATSTLFKILKSGLPFNGALVVGGPIVFASKLSNLVDSCNGVAFRNGKLYVAQASDDRVVEVNPATGQILRTVVAIDYPLDIKVDPLTGDLFVSSLAGLGAGGIFHIQNAESSSATIVRFSNNQESIDGISFALDGTVYASQFYRATVIKIPRTTNIFSVFGPNINAPDGSAIANCSGKETLLSVSSADRAIFLLDVATGAGTSIFTGASSKLDLAFVGPDNAFYVSQHIDPSNPRTLVIRVANPDCNFTVPPPPGGEPAVCGANCATKTVSVNCGSASYSSSGTCASLDFSSTVQNC